MKRNLMLFGVFLFLLLGTYLFQELKTVEDYKEALVADRLVDFEVNHLKFPGGIDAFKKNGQWWEGEQLLSHNTFKLIEKKLIEIKKIKEIQGEWSAYFPNPFSFEINHVKWTIGDLSLDKQAFYIAQGNKIYLAVIEGESVQLTHSSEEIASIKLNELVSALSTPKEKLKELQFFRYYPELPLERIVITVEGSLPFELDLKSNQTLPPPFKGVFVHKDLKGKFFSMLTQINIKGQIDYSEKIKFKKLADIRLMKDSKELIWELWLRNKDSADSVIIDPLNKKAFQMVGGTLKLFFVRLQDYWDKKVIPAKDFVSFSRLSAKFYQGQEMASITILNREPLEFESKKYKVNQLKMEQLIHYIFNLGPNDQADRVSPLSLTEKKQILSGNHLRVELMNQELILWKKTEELIVVNLTQGFKAHFNLLDDKFLGTFEDVLK